MYTSEIVAYRSVYWLTSKTKPLNYSLDPSIKPYLTLKSVFLSLISS